MINTIYSVYRSADSIKEVIGYFPDESEAIRYCNSQNSHGVFWKYEMVALRDISGCISYGQKDNSSVETRDYYTIKFDFSGGMFDPKSYTYKGPLRADSYQYRIIERNGICDGVISFSFSCISRDKAIKIALDKFSEFMRAYHITSSYADAAKIIGAKASRTHFDLSEN